MGIEHQRSWERTEGNVQSKRMLRVPTGAVAKDALRMNRRTLRKVVGFISGHWMFRGHLHKMGLPVQSLLCRKCGEEEESAFHVLFECPALQGLRAITLGRSLVDQEEEQTTIVKMVSGFIKDLGFDDE